MDIIGKLPDGYSFSDQQTIQAEAIIALRQACNWTTETNSAWDAVLEQSLATVGAREEHGSLVGIGFLAGNIRHAVLCDFTVHPDHRGRGIGKAILLKRMEIASDMGIPFIYTNLAAANSLRTLYTELGFVATGSDRLAIAR